MSGRSGAAAALGGLLAIAAGCAAAPGSLEGSVSADFDLRYDDLEIVRDGPVLTIRYLREVRFDQVAYAGTNTVAEVRLEGDPGPVTLGESLDVTGLLELERYVMTITPANEVVQDDRDFPEIYVAEMVFDVIGALPGEPCAGSFRVIFTDGETLRGSFEGDLAAPAF